MNTSTLKKHFAQTFPGNREPRLFFAPGRINLIGEHTDYNGGHVFPASISFGTYAVAAKREDKLLRFCSMNFPDEGIVEVSLEDLSYQEADKWANFPKGMIHYFLEEGYRVDQGADILYSGDIPPGAGLSSSASIELVTGVLLEGLYDLEIDRIQMIQLGQLVENHYIGVNSGIMDQFAIGKGRKDHAILLDCQTLDYSYAPLKLKDHTIVIMNTNKNRELAGSKYNERRAECERALAALQTKLDIRSLGDLTTEQFEQHQHLIRNETDRKRAKHAVSENARTLMALEELEAGNLEQFGRLMNDSHRSLQQDYEVTGLELDTLVSAAWNQEGVLGARMTGAGFGGCAIAIVEKKKIERFEERVNAVYEKEIGYPAAFYPASIGDGAKELTGEMKT